MTSPRSAGLCALALCAAPLHAQQAPAAPPSPRVPPRLVVAISIDQLSADLFAQYRGRFTGGLARLAGGVVFPSGYQAHAATETCPGHSTILTGSHPARTGIIANTWVDLKTARADKAVYCAEDERVPGSTSRNYVVSAVHLKAQTLGDRMKAANPAAKVASVAGKDRAAVMMAGHVPDQIWWWKGDRFTSHAGRTSAAADRTNAVVAQTLARPRPALATPPACAVQALPVAVGGATIGTGAFAREAGDGRAFLASPEGDGATLALAAALVDEMGLGADSVPDVLSIGLSATDYVGHGYGTEGSEMCLQLTALDASLGDFLARLDAKRLDYVVVLTADHGGLDLPERARERGIPDAARVMADLAPDRVSQRVGAALGLPGDVITGDGSFGDMWVSPALTPADRARVVAEAKRLLSAHPQVHRVLTRAEILATPMPTGDPSAWTVAQRARASYDPTRSGDYVVLLKPQVTPIATPRAGASVATHGSAWDYDRRVPILFWGAGISRFEQPAAIATVDILPTLAPLIGLVVPPGEIDGVCRDLDAGPGTTCR